MRYETTGFVLCDGVLETRRDANGVGLTRCEARAETTITTTVFDSGTKTKIKPVEGWRSARERRGVIVPPGTNPPEPRMLLLCPACSARLEGEPGIHVSKRVDTGEP